MTSVAVWILTLAIGLAGVIVTAGSGGGLLNFAITGAVCLALTGLAIVERRQLAAAGANAQRIAASDARYMGLVWTWGAVSLIAVYNFVLRWPEWWMFFLGFAVAAIAALALAAALERDAGSPASDGTMLKLARILGGVQAIGMIATIVGLIVDRKMTRYLNPLKYPDWVGNNVFFCGAAALLVLSLVALMSNRKT